MSLAEVKAQVEQQAVLLAIILSTTGLETVDMVSMVVEHDSAQTSDQG